MFAYNSVLGFSLRFFIFLVVFSTYPLLVFFETSCICNLFFRNTQVSDLQSFLMSASCTLVSLLFAWFYPNVGLVLSYFGAVAGLLIIYCLPVFVHLKHKRTTLTNPLLAEAIKKNRFESKQGDTSPQIALSDEFIKKHGIVKSKPVSWRFKLYYWCHMLIPLYGAATVFFQFYKI